MYVNDNTTQLLLVEPKAKRGLGFIFLLFCKEED